MAKKTSGAEASSSGAAEPEVLAADEIGAEYVEVDEVAAAAVAAATAPAATAATAEAPPSEGKRAKGRTRRKTGRKSQDELAARSAAENVWVREDLRRIGIVSVILIVALAVFFIVFGVVDVLNLY
jgi:hypothetical protein